MITLTATVDGSPWTAQIDLNGSTTILKHGRVHDYGYDCGELIHDTTRTPEHVLDALLDSWNEHATEARHAV